MPDDGKRIRFEIRTHCLELKDEEWSSRTVETGLRALGGTHEEAERENGQDNLALVRSIRDEDGYEVAKQYLAEHGIESLLVDEDQVPAEQQFLNEKQVLFA